MNNSTSMTRLSLLETLVHSEFPKVQFKYKTDLDSNFIKVLFALISVFNNKFMTEFTTVIGNTIWWPSQEFKDLDQNRSFRVLAHEYVHMCDKKKEGSFLFAIKYLFPQCIGTLGLLGFLGFLWQPLFWLFTLFICFMPWPAPYRVNYEYHGYAMSYACSLWQNDEIDWEPTQKRFSDWSYYKMQWNEETYISKMHELMSTTQPFLKIKDIIDKTHVTNHIE